MVIKPRQICAIAEGTEITITDPSTTQGQPTRSIERTTPRSNLKSLLIPFLDSAPIPRKTTATLCVPKAVANGSPNRIRTGNWMKPAPPPETLAKRLARKVRQKRILSLIIS